jgi:hypothetical protein
VAPPALHGHRAGQPGRDRARDHGIRSAGAHALADQRAAGSGITAESLRHGEAWQGLGVAKVRLGDISEARLVLSIEWACKNAPHGGANRDTDPSGSASGTHARFRQDLVRTYSPAAPRLQPRTVWPQPN